MCNMNECMERLVIKEEILKICSSLVLVFMVLHISFCDLWVLGRSSCFQNDVTCWTWTCRLLMPWMWLQATSKLLSIIAWYFILQLVEGKENVSLVVKVDDENWESRLDSSLLEQSKKKILQTLNFGSIKELKSLQLIGDKKAKLIMGWREINGDFTQVRSQTSEYRNLRLVPSDKPVLMVSVFRWKI